MNTAVNLNDIILATICTGHREVLSPQVRLHWTSGSVAQSCSCLLAQTRGKMLHIEIPAERDVSTENDGVILSLTTANGYLRTPIRNAPSPPATSPSQRVQFPCTRHDVFGSTSSLERITVYLCKR